MKGLDYFNNAKRIILANRALEFCKQKLYDYEESSRDGGYLENLKSALIQSKSNRLDLCQIKFMPDCSIDQAAELAFTTTTEDAYITMGNNVWDIFYKYSDLWIERFIVTLESQFQPLCNEKGWHCIISKNYPNKRNRSTISLTCEIHFNI